MKKTVITSLLAMAAMSAAAQLPTTGTMLLDIGIGAGRISVPDNGKASFTQRLAFEYVVKDDLAIFGQDFAIGVGLAVNNGYARLGKYELTGVYDYEYNIVQTGYTIDYNTGKRENVYQVNTQRRSGFGHANAALKRDDITFLPQATLHYSPMDRLDTYLTLGFGLGVINSFTGSKEDATGFDTENYSETRDTPYTHITKQYSYNDLSHADWGDTSVTKCAFGMSLAAGARWWFTPRVAAGINLGLVSAAFKKSMGHDYNILSLGATIKL